jgi:hypothetical protein
MTQVLDEKLVLMFCMHLDLSDTLCLLHTCSGFSTRVQYIWRIYEQMWCDVATTGSVRHRIAFLTFHWVLDTTPHWDNDVRNMLGLERLIMDGGSVRYPQMITMDGYIPNEDKWHGYVRTKIKRDRFRLTSAKKDLKKTYDVIPEDLKLLLDRFLWLCPSDFVPVMNKYGLLITGIRKTDEERYNNLTLEQQDEEDRIARGDSDSEDSDSEDSDSEDFEFEFSD